MVQQMGSMRPVDDLLNSFWNSFWISFENIFLTWVRNQIHHNWIHRHGHHYVEEERDWGSRPGLVGYFSRDGAKILLPFLL